MGSVVIAYQKFRSPEAAQPLLALLDAHRVAYETDHLPARFSAVLGTTSAEQFVVRLLPEDFTRVRRIEEAQAAAALPNFPSDYYLFKFSTPELWELLGQPDAWSSHDVALAAQVLRERGQDVSDQILQNLRAQHTARLAAPNPSPTAWIAAGYGLALLGGVFGLGIGWSLLRYRKTLPDGRQVPGFAPADRAHGRRILWLGAAGVVFWVAVRVMMG
ncbi:hypothetical protein ACFQ48_01415 [Hymenobacter caeli]|uniref:DUF2007 domain-containing protein n=1 Tax=Hymenobacter caeli TaxID=2735894 RepID=A0ABX2FM15_9BACT|nr:hypothetical protein [Hymenobacter caeli]NRT17479.1 hypothetical protein [Hymenobacter caeli]